MFFQRNVFKLHTIYVGFNVRRDCVDIFELFLTERAGEILRSVYSGVVDKLVLCRETVLALFAAELVAFTERASASTIGLVVF